MPRQRVVEQGGVSIPLSKFYRSRMEIEMKAGDVVALIAGGAMMTVHMVDWTDQSAPVALCGWFDPLFVARKGSFQLADLTKVNTNSYQPRLRR